jgi:integrase
VTEAQVIAWASDGGSNNNIRGRISVALTFLGWCADNGIATCDLTRLRRLKRQYPKVYGRAQAPNPARWLTHAEAFDRLIPACQDGTLLGLRDELAIRFGLSGMRRAEILRLTWRNLADLPAVEWMGKGNRPRRIVIGPTFVEALQRWHDAYPDPDPDAPVICRTAGTVRPRVDWGHGYQPNTTCLHKIVTSRAEQAGLGHVAPHDLRRSAAGILHTSTDDNGAHFFDLLDIQKVLGHADPATTMRSYLDPMDTGVLDRAAVVLD